MNLHETSWILFADKGSHRNESFGWPGISKKEKIWIKELRDE